MDSLVERPVASMRECMSADHELNVLEEVLVCDVQGSATSHGLSFNVEQLAGGFKPLTKSRPRR